MAERYAAYGACQTRVNEKELSSLGIKTISRPMLDCSGGYAHHDSDKLALEIMSLYRDKSPTKVYG